MKAKPKILTSTCLRINREYVSFKCTVTFSFV